MGIAFLHHDPKTQTSSTTTKFETKISKTASSGGLTFNFSFIPNFVIVDNYSPDGSPKIATPAYIVYQGDSVAFCTTEISTNRYSVKCSLYDKTLSIDSNTITYYRALAVKLI